jgi:hypothetical protein
MESKKFLKFFLDLGRMSYLQRLQKERVEKNFGNKQTHEVGRYIFRHFHLYLFAFSSLGNVLVLPFSVL